MNILSFRQKIVIGASLLCIIVVSCIYLLTPKRDSTPVSSITDETHTDSHDHFHGDLKPDTTPKDPRTDKVFIKDFQDLETDIDLETRKHIESRLYAATVNASKNEPGLYIGSIRPKSYKNTSSDNFKTTRFFVDVEPARLTYEVTITHKNKDGGRDVYIACALDDQKMTDSTACRQGAA